MHRNTLLLIVAAAFWSGQVFSAALNVSPEKMQDLRSQRASLVAKVEALDEVGRQLDKAQSDRNIALNEINRQEIESNQARDKLEKLQNFDRENPGSISADQLRTAEERNKQAFRALKAAKEQRINAEARIGRLNVEADSQYAEFQRMHKIFERDVGRVADVHLQERIRDLQVSKEVEVTERVACGDDSIPVCKERSKKAAELKATERGSVVFVNSLTEVKNFKLSKEELRSEVRATLSDKVFSNLHMVGETEYEATLKASVVPAIGDSLHEQMAGAIRADIYAKAGGKIDLSGVRNPALTSLVNAGIAANEADPVKPFSEKNQRAIPQQEQEVPLKPTTHKVDLPTFSF